MLELDACDSNCPIRSNMMAWFCMISDTDVVTGASRSFKAFVSSRARNAVATAVSTFDRNGSIWDVS